MQRHEPRFEEGFDVVTQNDRAQAAVMVLAAGDSTGGPDNAHDDADQWLFVLSGDGEAIVNGQPVPLASGTLLLIERGETHEIRNTGRAALKTLNLYVPPEY